MKTIASLLLILLVFSSHQTNAQVLRTYGAKFGITSSDEVRDYSTFTPTTKRRTGFNFGVYAEWFDLPIISIVTQLEYSQRGFGDNFLYTDETGPQSGKILTLYDRLDYLSVPLLAKFSTTFAPIKPYALLGPRFDILIGRKADIPGEDILYDNFKKPVLGGTVGIGAELNSGLPVTLSLEARYNFDLMDSYSNPNLSVQNNTFDLWIGASI